MSKLFIIDNEFDSYTHREKIIFYVEGVDGKELFEGVVKRRRNYTEIDKFTIVDKSDRLSEYEFRFQQKYGN